MDELDQISRQIGAIQQHVEWMSVYADLDVQSESFNELKEQIKELHNKIEGLKRTNKKVTQQTTDVKKE